MAKNVLNRLAAIIKSRRQARPEDSHTRRLLDLCDRHGHWLHVDGAHGASALLSSVHRHRVRGLERARSLAWDPHKMLLLPLSTGMVLVERRRGSLSRMYQLETSSIPSGLACTARTMTSSRMRRVSSSSRETSW